MSNGAGGWPLHRARINPVVPTLVSAKDTPGFEDCPFKERLLAELRAADRSRLAPTVPRGRSPTPRRRPPADWPTSSPPGQSSAPACAAMARDWLPEFAPPRDGDST